MRELLYNVDFEIAGAAYILVMFIFLKVQYINDSEGNRRFSRLLLVGLFTNLFDIITTITITYADVVPLSVNLILNMLLFMLTALFGHSFVMYLVAFIGSDDNGKWIKIAHGVYIAYAILQVLNLVTGWVFSFQTNAGGMVEYVHGPIYPIIFVVPMLYLLLASGMMIIYRRSFPRKQQITMVIFMIMCFLGSFVQAVFTPHIMLGCAMPAVALLCIFFSLETPDYQRLQEAFSDLAQAKAEAQKADEAKSRFLAQMSHEIRTPINAVLGMNEMILRECANGSIREYSENIKSAGNTLLALINDILDFTKLDEHKLTLLPVNYDVSSLINDLVNTISERAKNKGLEFRMEIDPKIPCSLFGDDIRIRQIATNLLTNAVKYTEKGYFKLGISVVSRKNNMVKLLFEVTDTGIGIKKEEMGKLFRLFQRLDDEKTRSIEGTGLGIMITESLLRMMNSTLKVESDYGSGSRFFFELEQKIVDDEPIGDFAERRKRSLAEEKAQRFVYAPKASILIVDDNGMNLKVACALLKRNGIVPDTAASGKECLKLAAKKHYDIIFMDHMMPEMDGIETLRMLEQNGTLSDDTVVIAMTANAVVGAKEEYLENGFADYLSKPIEVAELEKTLAEYLPKGIVSYAGDDTIDLSGENLTFTERFAFLDLTVGMKYCLDDEAFYEEMIASYIECDKLGEIRMAFEKRDWENYRTLVHALKSTSLSIGAVELSEKAKALEFAAKDNDIAFIAANHMLCMNDYERLLGRLRAALGTNEGKSETVNEASDAPRILVTDDNAMSLKMAERLLSGTYIVETANSGKAALERLKRDPLPDLLLLDLHMPNMDGFEVLNRVKSDFRTHNLPVIFLTADDDRAAEIRGFKEGAHDFIRKPFIAEIMLERVKRTLELSRLRQDLWSEVTKQTSKADKLTQEAVLSLAKAVEMKDKYTNGHSERVAKYSAEIARRAGFDENTQREVYFIGLLHDIGKIGVPDTVINKPSRLTDEEYEMVKKHPQIGADILKNITAIPGIEQGARYHHERYDGKGYPDGISGTDIPLYARIIGVADAYDAMTSNRSYRGIQPQERVREEIVKGKGTQFDPQFADYMVEMIDDDKEYKMHEGA